MLIGFFDFNLIFPVFVELLASLIKENIHPLCS